MGKTGLQIRTWRMLAVAMLAACLALGLAVAQPRQALAEPRNDLSFTVRAQSAETYDIGGYMLFSAHVDAESKAASEVSWNDAYKDVVHGFIEGAEYSAFLAERDLIDDAQGALSFISMKIEDSSGITTKPVNDDYPGQKATGGQTFATQLAQAIAQSEGVTPTTGALQQVSSGHPATFSGLTGGFYLFYGADLPPIWTPVSAVDDVAYIKDTLQLAAVKQVWDEHSRVWQGITAAGSGQQVQFRVISEMPNMVPSAGTSFSYTLSDTLPDGLTVGSASDVKVYATDDPDRAPHKIDVTSYFEGGTVVSTDDHTLTSTCPDLFSSNGSEADVMRSGDMTHIIFEYAATLNDDARSGSTSYNANTAVVSYTKGTTIANNSEEATAKVTTFSLEVVVADNQAEPRKMNQPAQFTLYTEAYGAKKYLTADGGLVDEADLADDEQILTVEGSFQLETIPPGTYVLEEVKAPDGYKVPAVNPMRITITPVYNEAGDALDAINVSHNSTDDWVLVEADASEGSITVYAKNEPKTYLPITGMEPSQLGTIIGALLVACGIGALLIRTRRKAKAQVEC